jgi:hypothetical protein
MRPMSGEANSWAHAHSARSTCSAQRRHSECMARHDCRRATVVRPAMRSSPMCSQEKGVCAGQPQEDQLALQHGNGKDRGANHSS